MPQICLGFASDHCCHFAKSSLTNSYIFALPPSRGTLKLSSTLANCELCSSSARSLEIGFDRNILQIRDAVASVWYRTRFASIPKGICQSYLIKRGHPSVHATVTRQTHPTHCQLELMNAPPTRGRRQNSWPLFAIASREKHRPASQSATLV